MQFRCNNIYRSNKENITAENLFLLNSDRDIIYASNYIEIMKNSKKGNF